jgi:hypothetical protein
MRDTVLRSFGTCFFALVVASVLSYGHQVSTDYSQKSVTELIDDLTQIDSESIAINTSYLRGFIGDETPASIRTNRYGVVLPDAPPQMRELVRRGPLALPDLIKHLDDTRPTKLDVGGPPPGSPGVFVGKVFGYEYSPRVRDSEAKGSDFRWTKKSFANKYTLRVGDVCYALIGQIVNRGLQLLRNQPTGFLVLNSPIEAPILVEKVKSDWGNGEPEMVKSSLMADIHIADFAKEPKAPYIEVPTNEALRRLRLYFPDAYNALSGNDLQRKIKFEASEHHSSNR